MQTNASPQYWFQMPSKSTEELTQIWQAGVDADHPEINLELVEQVLMARHVLEPTQSFLSVPQVGFFQKPVEKRFSISQQVDRKIRRHWDLVLEQDQAVFTAWDGSERLLIDRLRSRGEFQFKRRGLLLLSEGTCAIVRGKTFDFGRNKKYLTKWLPPLTSTDLQKEQSLWAVLMVFMGAFSLLLNSSLNQIIGGILTLLGLLNFILHKQGVWVFNGLVLLVNGALMLGNMVFLIVPSQRPDLVVTLFWIFLGLVQVVLGFQAARQFDRYSYFDRHGN